MNALRLRPLAAAALPALWLAAVACTDRDVLDDGPSAAARGTAIAFSGSVDATPGTSATRADGSLINLNETSLRPSHEHIYYRADESGNVDPEGVAATFYAGIFGCYTGQHRWRDLVRLAADQAAGGTLTDDQQAVLSEHYTANLFYNQRADIGERPDGQKGGNPLTYAPERFWPNNLLQRVDGAEADGQHEYVTLWAYYPYNATGSMGDYGITLNETTVGKAMGMGRVKFSMNPDAAQQVDFLMSFPVVDANKDRFPLVSTAVNEYAPKPVPFRFRHMLAQVRIYAYVTGADRMVYLRDDAGLDILADGQWFDEDWQEGETIADAYGNVYTKRRAEASSDAGQPDGTTHDIYIVEQTTKVASFGADSEYARPLTRDEFLALGLRVPDESQCQRWEREDVWDVTRTRRRAKLSYQLSLNNIMSETEFYPEYDAEGEFVALRHDAATTMRSATVRRYLMNPYWFRFGADGRRVKLNDDYMFGYYERRQGSSEPTAACRGLDATATDGVDWSKLVEGTKDVHDPLNYLYDANGKELDYVHELSDVDAEELHYNFAPGNILMVVPQKLDDDNVPHVTLTVRGPKAGSGQKADAAGDSAAGDAAAAETYTAKLTVNMLKMDITWESGYIYCYAFIDELRPGDDKVQGPESITVYVHDGDYTDQW